MNWTKKGLIFAPPHDLPWMATHAALPVADRIGDRHRVYYSGRDPKGRAQIGFFELDLEHPEQILRISEHPAIGLGSLGAFDDNGVTSCWIVEHAGRKYQYYTGWSLGVTVPFYFYVGLAVSDDGGESYQKVSRAPILERNDVDPYLTASPCVLVEDGLWRMWYISCTGWEQRGDQPMHYYHVKYAESRDGIQWQRTGTVCIDYQSPGEYAFARPCVIKSDGVYKMWYSYRGASYRLGYAESDDGLSWRRRDAAVGIGVSEAGWDSELLAYAHVFEHHGRQYMLYNGNGYGKTGIGLAVLDPKQRDE
jgi:hypothetical protein